ncbi:MAG: hypothetical protein ACYDD0_02715 [Candidatus Dormibacteria bacterium]
MATVALNPGTQLKVIAPVLDEMDLLRLLAVNPGWAGQTVISSMRRRVEAAQARIAGREVAISVDGGVTQADIEEVASLGADLVVSDSAIFDGGTPTANARSLLSAVRRGWPTPVAESDDV